MSKGIDACSKLVTHCEHTVDCWERLWRDTGRHFGPRMLGSTVTVMVLEGCLFGPFLGMWSISKGTEACSKLATHCRHNVDCRERLWRDKGRHFGPRKPGSTVTVTVLVGCFFVDFRPSPGSVVNVHRY